MNVPVIDVSALSEAPWPMQSPDAPTAAVADVARQIDSACREVGFFTIVGHGIDPGLLTGLEERCRRFFALPEAEKARISMSRGGRAWRGWFPLDGELTSGVPDHKEGIYFGAEIGPDDPRVLAGTPLHGHNLFPERPEGLGELVLAIIDELTGLGHRLVAAMGIGLGLGADYFDTHLTTDPVVLMRVFQYPAVIDPRGWGVAEHTDYGLLTLLHQDHTGGLQVRSGTEWLDVDPVEGSLVCNLGDMLERMTGGSYRATPHRVCVPEEDRVSIPFFFDPSWDAEVVELPLEIGANGHPRGDLQRWDGTDLRNLSGTYGDYLVSKVSRVFPELGQHLTVGDHPGADRGVRRPGS